MNVRRSTAWIFAALLGACSSNPDVIEPAPESAPAKFSPPEASQIYVDKGVKYMEAGSYEIALQDMKRAIELDDDNSEAYNAIGVLYERIDDYANADSSFRKALSVKPDNYGARNNYGRFLCNRGKTQEAFEQFDQITSNKLYDQPWVALTNAGICARKAGKRAEAEGYLRKALDAAPNFPPSLLEMAKLSQENRQLMSARAFLERYFAAAGNGNPEALKLGIEIETALGNEESAQEYAAMLRKRSPGGR